MSIQKRLHFMQGLIVGLLTTFIVITLQFIPTGFMISRTLDTEYNQNRSEHLFSAFHLTNDSHVHNDDDSVAMKLKEKVRVFVGIMTAPKNLQKRAQAVKDTWAKRCNKIIFFSTEENKEFPTVRLEVPEGYNHLTAKTMTAFSYIYKHYFNDFDWFMKADDDTNVIMENLRYFLSSQNTSEPVFFGHHFLPHVKQGYVGGGAGYVLSKEALRRYGEKENKSLCREDGGAEDLEMGRCLEKLGVRIGNSTDSLGRSRFHSFIPEVQLTGEFPGWYYSYDAHGCKKGPQSISDYIISFHEINATKMMQLHFFVYHLRPYGIFNGDQNLNLNDSHGLNS